METYVAYCSVCDARVEVSFEPAEGEPGAPVRVRCLDHYPGCGGDGCPLPAGTLEEPAADVARLLGRHLEFVPLKGRPRWPATLSDSAAVVRRGRRASLARQLRKGPDDPA